MTYIGKVEGKERFSLSIWNRSGNTIASNIPMKPHSDDHGVVWLVGQDLKRRYCVYLHGVLDDDKNLQKRYGIEVFDRNGPETLCKSHQPHKASTSVLCDAIQIESPPLDMIPSQGNTGSGSEPPPTPK